MKYPLIIQFFLFVIIVSCSNSKSVQIKEQNSSPSNFTLIEDVVDDYDFGMAPSGFENRGNNHFGFRVIKN
jgi:hypothetical protein